MDSPTIQKLIDLFSKFPTVGPRTASRFVFYLINLPKEEFDKFLESVEDLKKNIKICSFCFSPFEDTSSATQIGSAKQNKNLCPICRNNLRDRSLLCVVEKEIDLISIEKTKKYNGLYFILGGTINFKKSKKIRTEEFKERVKNYNFKEIILALNPTTEGETTALYLERLIKSIQMPKNKKLPKITRLGRGLPTGGELEYADEETMENAFLGRK